MLLAGDLRCSGSFSVCPAQQTGPQSQTWRMDVLSSLCLVKKFLLQLLLDREEDFQKGQQLQEEVSCSVQYSRQCMHPTPARRDPKACQMLCLATEHECIRIYFTTRNEVGFIGCLFFVGFFNWLWEVGFLLGWFLFGWCFFKSPQHHTKAYIP